MRTLSKIFSSALVFSLLLGAVLLPFRVEAGFLSSILGNDASADTNLNNGVGQAESKNSQTMGLLQANVLSYDENENVKIVDNAILPAIGPLGVSNGANVPDSAFDQTSVYVVRKGDSLSEIAEMFGVSVNTILVANDMKRGDKIAPGDVLFILPISGLEHTVVKGQTLQSIAKFYKVNVNDIVFYNGLTEDTKLAIGDVLMIPGGEMAHEGGDKPAPNLKDAVARDKNYYDTHPIANIAGYFINPVPTGRKTQGLHGPGHRGIDIGAPKGTPIYASASGTVLIAKTGWSGGYGNMVIIRHSNGTKTLYAHMTKLGTHTGASVARGEVIGYVGSTGRSTGPHLHFEVFNAKNPGALWSWAN